MRRFLVRGLLTAAVAIASGAVATGQAQAASSTGAQVFNTPEQCFTYEFGTQCYGQHLEYNATSTPSGNVSIQGNRREVGDTNSVACGGSYTTHFDRTEHFHF